MKRIPKFLIPLIVFLLLISPALSLAQIPTTAAQQPAGLVPCTNTPSVSGTTVTYPGGKCDFYALMALVNKVINFILVGMVVPIAAIMFAYAGFELITAGGESAHARTQAKKIFFNAVIGLVIAVAAWLIVSTVLSILGYDGTWIGLHIGS